MSETSSNGTYRAEKEKLFKAAYSFRTHSRSSDMLRIPLQLTFIPPIPHDLASFHSRKETTMIAVNFTMLIQLLTDIWLFRMDDLDVHAGSSDEDMVQNVKTRAIRKKVCKLWN